MAPDVPGSAFLRHDSHDPRSPCHPVGNGSAKYYPGRTKNADRGPDSHDAGTLDGREPAAARAVFLRVLCSGRPVQSIFGSLRIVAAIVVIWLSAVEPRPRLAK